MDIIRRTRCVVYTNNSNEIQLFSYDNGVTEWTLDLSAAWIWALVSQSVDGLTIDSLANAIVSQYPNLTEEEASEEIQKLIDAGILYLKNNKKTDAEAPTAQQKSKLDNLNVYFSNSLNIDPNNSYLLYLLWHTANTVTVTNDPKAADLVFCNNVGEHKKGDSDTLCVLLSDTPKGKNLDQFDYIISSKAAWNPYHTHWMRLPDKAFDPTLNLPAEMLELSVLPNFGIQRLSEKLLNFLIGAEQQPQQELLPVDPFLTIGMATYDDYDGVYFSLISLQIHHPEVFNNSEIIILDNNPTSHIAEHLKNLANHNQNVRYVPYTDKNSTAVRDVLFSLARGKWVMCMDCHVMLPPKALDRLVDYMQQHPDSLDLLQGPMNSDAGKPYATQMDNGWRSGMYGTWGSDDRGKDIDAEPFEIEMQGLGLFACRKAAWPGFNKLFSGFGGEEGYIHQKIRNQGGKCLCLPFFRWSHRFARPAGAKYANNWIDRIKNYYIGFAECGLPTDQIGEHFSELLNPHIVERAKKDVDLLLKSPFHKFEHAVCINLDSSTGKWEAMQNRFESLGIKDKVTRFSAIATPEHHHIGCALSHRKVIEHAKLFGYKNILVFEDDALMLPGAEVYLAQAMQELEGKQWKILYLGGAQHRFKIDFDKDCHHLKLIPKYRVTCTHALAYHESVYDELLEAMPNNEEEMAEWLIDNHGIDQHLTKIDSRYMVYPKPFSQPGLKINEDEPYRYFYK